MDPATKPSGSLDLMEELDFAFLAESRSTSVVGTDGNGMLLEKERSSDEESSGSMRRRIGMVSFILHYQRWLMSR